jgi:hypothetical protein
MSNWWSHLSCSQALAIVLAAYLGIGIGLARRAK